MGDDMYVYEQEMEDEWEALHTHEITRIGTIYWTYNPPINPLVPQ